MTLTKGSEMAGTAQLLEVLSAVLQGVKLPLKEEHVEMVERVLVPLHRCLTQHYHFYPPCSDQLSL